MHLIDEDVQVTVEQQALEDYLLTDPPLKAAASQILSVRAASPDVVTQVLTQLSSKPPQELWTLIHADAAAGGKPAKAAPAKALAAVKGKAGKFDHLNVTTHMTRSLLPTTRWLLCNILHVCKYCAGMDSANDQKCCGLP